jgi:hypothetical protein
VFFVVGVIEFGIVIDDCHSNNRLSLHEAALKIEAKDHRRSSMP